MIRGHNPNLRGICALLGFEVRERLGDGIDKGIKRSCGGLAKCRFELGEGSFDGIEIGAVGRQMAQRRAGPFDRFFDASDFVTGERSTPDAPAGGELSITTTSPGRKVGARKCST